MKQRYSQLGLKILGKNLYVKDCTDSELKIYNQALSGMVQAATLAAKMVNENRSALRNKTLASK